MKILVIILGVVTSVFLNGEWLTIANESWVLVYADLTTFLFGENGLNRTIETIFLIIWVQLPLIIIFTLLCSILISKFGHQRFYIYSYLATTTFVFFVLDKLPIFNLLLQPLGGMRYYNVFSNLFLFLTLFFVFSKVIQKHNKQINQDK